MTLGDYQIPWKNSHIVTTPIGLKATSFHSLEVLLDDRRMRSKMSIAWRPPRLSHDGSGLNLEEHRFLFSAYIHILYNHVQQLDAFYSYHLRFLTKRVHQELRCMTPAPACQIVSMGNILIITKTGPCTYLVARVDKSIGNHHVLATTSGKDDNLGNVVGSERFNAPVSFRLARPWKIEPHPPRELTCKQRRPWTCRHRIARQRTPTLELAPYEHKTTRTELAYSLNLTGINSDNTDPRRDKLLA